jgi:GntR family transcriptional regulator, transcriptional repressor for pyruvate dehydrogenase complex
MAESIRTEKIRDRIASRLRSYIARHDLKVGDRLPTETQLALQFGVSRLSVREATKTLEFLGIVKSKPGLGLSVGQIDLERIGELIGSHPAIQSASARQLIETRIVVETGVLPHVMRRMKADPAVHASLQQIVQRMRKVRKLRDFIELDVEFHRSLVAASQLSPLLAINELLTVFFREFRESVKKAQRMTAIESHQTLIDLLRDQRLEEACDALREHIESHLERK